MEAEIVALAPDPNKDEPDAYERKILFGFKLVGAIGIGLLTAFLLFLGFIIIVGIGIQQSLA